jgi:uncharacterized protein YkwD
LPSTATSKSKSKCNEYNQTSPEKGKRKCNSRCSSSYYFVSRWFECGDNLLTASNQKLESISQNFNQYDLSIGGLIGEMNNQRKIAGVAPLVENKTLNKSTLLKARQAVDENDYNHSADILWPFKTTGYPDGCVTVGENLAFGYTTSKQAVDAWMASTKGHREAILNPDYENVGVAIDFRLTGGIPDPVIVAHFCTGAR